MARIETLQEFKLRTEWISKDSLRTSGGGFSANGKLREKVNEDGTLTNRDNPDGDWFKEKFCGNTLVFLLDEKTRDRLGEIQDRLYQAAGSIMAEPLDKDTFHMTLHELKSGVPSEALRLQMERSEKAVRPILHAIKTDGVVEIRMKATELFNLNNSVVVLGLAPIDEENCERLMRLYELFQHEESIRLPYRLTPHIALGYFRVGNFGEEQVDRMKNMVDKINRELHLVKPIEIRLTTGQLVYQTFTDMNHYQTVE